MDNSFQGASCARITPVWILQRATWPRRYRSSTVLTNLIQVWWKTCITNMKTWTGRRFQRALWFRFCLELFSSLVCWEMASCYLSSREADLLLKRTSRTYISEIWRWLTCAFWSSAFRPLLWRTCSHRGPLAHTCVSIKPLISEKKKEMFKSRYVTKFRNCVAT